MWLSYVLLTVAGFSCVACAVELSFLFRLMRRQVVTPASWPDVSILKPLAGYDDDLVANLESHLQLDYPASYEVLLGVRSTADAAYPVAVEFAARFPDKVRVVVQEGEPGFNPKVNQLITLTRHAKHEVIALTDSNVRVPKHWLSELVSMLSEPGVGLSTNLFAGVGENTLGSALDNMTLSSFCDANLATGEIFLKITQIVGKSLAVRKSTMAAIGGWEEVKDLLAEDQRLGFKLSAAGFRTRACRTCVENVQRTQPLSHFFRRHSRWAMLRFRVIPGVWLEQFLNPTIWGLFAFLSAPGWWVTQAAFAFTAVFSTLYTNACSQLTRGYGFKLKWLWLVPVRDLLFFGIWLRGMTLRTVDWRGNKLRVGKKTLLSRG